MTCDPAVCKNPSKGKMRKIEVQVIDDYTEGAHEVISCNGKDIPFIQQMQQEPSSHVPVQHQSQDSSKAVDPLSELHHADSSLTRNSTRIPAPAPRNQTRPDHRPISVPPPAKNTPSTGVKSSSARSLLTTACLLVSITWHL